jgi:hypothetical protein
LTATSRFICRCWTLSTTPILPWPILSGTTYSSHTVSMVCAETFPLSSVVNLSLILRANLL